MNCPHITESLLQRAVASAYLPRYGFIDRAAEVLVGQLAIGSKQLEHALNRVQPIANCVGHAHLIADLHPASVRNFKRSVNYPTAIKDSFPLEFKGRPNGRFALISRYLKPTSKAVYHLAVGQEPLER